MQKKIWKSEVIFFMLLLYLIQFIYFLYGILDKKIIPYLISSAFARHPNGEIVHYSCQERKVEKREQH